MSTQADATEQTPKHQETNEMTNRQLAHFTHTTLSHLIADMSHALAEGVDSADMSAAEWDSLHAEMLTVYNVSVVIVGAAIDDMLQAAGADPEMVYYVYA